MRARLFTTLLGSILCIAIAASGQSLITLQGGFSQGVNFSSTGSGGVAVNLGNCNTTGSCFLYGLGTGSGSLASMGFFVLDSSAGSFTVAGTTSSNGSAAVTQTAPAALSLFGIDTTNDTPGLLLAGNLDLTSLTQAMGSAGGSLAGNLQVTSGLLTGAMTSTSLPLQLNYTYPSGTMLSGGGNGTSTATFTSGSVGSVTPAPEPATLLLLAGGTLLLICLWLAVRQRNSLLLNN